jgi:competence transcription factor ComK
LQHHLIAQKIKEFSDSEDLINKSIEKATEHFDNENMEIYKSAMTCLYLYLSLVLDKSSYIFGTTYLCISIGTIESLDVTEKLTGLQRRHNETS